MLRFERRWLLRVFETLIPAGVDRQMPMGAADVPMHRFIDDLLEHAPLEFIIGLRACLWMIMLSPLFLLRRFRTFLGLEQSARLAVIDRLRTSRFYIVREAPLLFKTIGCLGFCGLPAVQGALGIHPIDATPPEWARVASPEPPR
ncbi:MAG TPA: hypothetical protein VF881_04160 [Polyangiaceae bacterium]